MQDTLLCGSSILFFRALFPSPLATLYRSLSCYFLQKSLRLILPPSLTLCQFESHKSALSTSFFLSSLPGEKAVFLPHLCSYITLCARALNHINFSFSLHQFFCYSSKKEVRLFTVENSVEWVELSAGTQGQRPNLVVRLRLFKGYRCWCWPYGPATPKICCLPHAVNIGIWVPSHLVKAGLWMLSTERSQSQEGWTKIGMNFQSGSPSFDEGFYLSRGKRLCIPVSIWVLEVIFRSMHAQWSDLSTWVGRLTKEVEYSKSIKNRYVPWIRSIHTSPLSLVVS